uniref:Uncharacterized protein n=1 Tax=Arundo donax TaxID=35708 RepID=A0A0A8YN98_ARUDO
MLMIIYSKLLIVHLNFVSVHTMHDLMIAAGVSHTLIQL